jgi:hypothetical protein
VSWQDGPPLTMQSILDAMAKLPAKPARRGIEGRRLLTSEYLTRTVPCNLSRWQVFRVWLEDACSRADLEYFWPHVQRERIEPLPEILLVGDDLAVCHPAMVPRIRQITRPVGISYQGWLS